MQRNLNLDCSENSISHRFLKNLNFANFYGAVFVFYKKVLIYITLYVCGQIVAEFALSVNIAMVLSVFCYCFGHRNTYFRLCWIRCLPTPINRAWSEGTVAD